MLFQIYMTPSPPYYVLRNADFFWRRFSLFIWLLNYIISVEEGQDKYYTGQPSYLNNSGDINIAGIIALYIL